MYKIHEAPTQSEQPCNPLLGPRATSWEPLLYLAAVKARPRYLCRLSLKYTAPSGSRVAPALMTGEASAMNCPPLVK